MFAGLRFDRIVGCHDKKRNIDSRCPGKHIADESLVPRHIDDPQAIFTQLKLGKTELDRNTTFLFFG